MSRVTTTDIYEDDLSIIDAHKVIPREARRDALHRLLIAADNTVKEVKKA